MQTIRSRPRYMYFHMDWANVNPPPLKLIQLLLATILIEITEDTKYEDITDILDDIDTLVPQSPHDEILSYYMNKVLDSAYSSNGSMVDISAVIREMLAVVNMLLA